MKKTLSQYIDNQGQNFHETSLIYSQGNLIAGLPTVFLKIPDL